MEKCKSKSQWDITSHQPQWLSSKNPETINAGEGVERRESFYTVGGNVNWYIHYGEKYRGSLKTENRATMWPCNPTPRHISGEECDPKGYMHSSIRSLTVYNSQNLEAT